MKVYIVERGCYSDRYVSGIFSSKELADANVVLHSDGDVTEHEVDEQSGDIKRQIYEVRVDLESGSIMSQFNYDTYGPPNKKADEPSILDYRGYGMSAVSPCFGKLIGKVASFVGHEHALKLAAEFRQNYLRQPVEILNQ